MFKTEMQMNYDGESLQKAGLLEDTYIRDPKTVSEYLAENFAGKKLLFYGRGFHTKEVLENPELLKITVGIADEPETDPSYIKHEIAGIPVFTENSLKSVCFDYLVLLGQWKKDSVENLLKRTGLSHEHLLMPYKIPELSERITDIFVKNNQLNLSENKPNLVLILTYDKKDFITAAAEYLSGYFNLIKIYIHSNLVYHTENKHFSQTVHLGHNIMNIKRLINEAAAPDLAVFWINSQYEMWMGMYVKGLMPEKTRFITASSDFFFSGLYNADPIEMGRCIGMSRELAQINMEAEIRLLKESSGVISNFTGILEKNFFRRYNSRLLFTGFFVDSSKFVFRENEGKGRLNKICFVGSIEFVNNDEENPIFTSSYFADMFRTILSQGFELHIYNPRQLSNDSSGEYIKLKNDFPETFIWHGFVPSAQLPAELSGYDFGLIPVNAPENVLKVYDTQFGSIFQGRIISTLAAGLPMIVSSEYRLAADYVSSAGAGICLGNQEMANLSEAVKKCDYKALKSGVRNLTEAYKKTDHKKAMRFFLENTLSCFDPEPVLSRLGLLNEDNGVPSKEIEDFINAVNTDKGRKLFLFCSYQNLPDPFRQSLKEISKVFSVYLIFTKTVQKSENDVFCKKVISINRNFRILADILRKTVNDVFVITNMGFEWSWYYLFIRKYTPGSVVVYGRDLMTVFHCKSGNVLKDFSGSEEKAALETAADRMILTEADGILTSFAGDAMQYINQHNSNAVCFLPLCPQEYNISEYPADDENIRLVYAGSLLPVDYSKKFNQESVRLELFKDILSDDSVLLDVYTEPGYSMESYSDYNILGARFRIYEGLPVRNLISVIKNHHYGLCVQDFRRMDTGIIDAHKYIIPTKIFTYLAAGIPVIINREYGEAANFVESNGLGLALNHEEMKHIPALTDKIAYIKMKNNIISFLSRNTLEKEIKKITALLEKAAEKYKI